jgi:1-phosphofructokinase family hexose kinase
VDDDELERLECAVKASLTGAKWLMLCGSLPPGAPPDFYAKLIRLAGALGVETLLDTDGDALHESLEAEPTAVTPNQQEAERLLNRALITRSHFRDAAEKIRAMGAKSVILSLGSRGAVGVNQDGAVEAIPPRIEAVCPIGSGDALAAAFTWARTQGRDFPDSVRWGVAAGTASACLPGLCFGTLDQTKQIYDRVELRPSG